MENEVSNLSAYLRTVSVFVREEISSTFSRYRQLFEYSKSILQFLKGQNICKKEAELSFEKLLAQPFPDRDFLSRLQLAIQLLIDEFSSLSPRTAEWIEPITQASIAIYLDERGDFLRYSMNQRVAGIGRVVQILYECSWTNDDEQDKISEDKTRLDRIINRVIDGEKRSDSFLTAFTRALTLGFLYRKIREIPDTTMRHIDQQVNSVANQMDFKAKLEKRLSALGTILESQLTSGTIMESLRMQLVGAYTITVPTGANVIGAIVKDLLPDTCRELAESDQGYAGLFLKSEGEEVSVGRYTRIGVVPFRMDFKEFANRLENAYRSAVRKYEQSGGMQSRKHSMEEYVANVIRIFPTSAYFRQLTPFEGKKAEDILANILRPLMIEKFGRIRTLQIIASLTAPDVERMSMRNTLANLYNSNSSIYLIAKNEFDGVLSSPTLTEFIRQKRLDETLIDQFNGQRLSDLAITIYRSSNMSGPDSIKQNLQKKISDMCRSMRARPADDEIQKVSVIIFEALYDVGMFLDVLSPTSAAPNGSLL
jgi:hypothetical protein